MRRVFCTVALAATAVVASPVSAKELTHALRANESVESLARHFYGASWKATYILGRNRVDDPKSLRTGTRLAIPSSWTYTVRRGDSLARLTKKYLGGTDRYKVLMRGNGIREGQDLQVGAELLMPFHIKYKVKKGDSLSAISNRFYRTTRRATWLRDYNLDTPELHPGNEIIVPIFDRATLDVRSKGPPALAKSDSAKTPPRAGAPDAVPPPAKGPVDRQTLRDAINSYLAGDFTAAQEQFEMLLANEPPDGTKATVLRYLGFCAVAHGQQGDAEDYFRGWLKVDPNAKLDPVQTSPKILEVFNQVRADVRDQG